MNKSPHLWLLNQRSFLRGAIVALLVVLIATPARAAERSVAKEAWLQVSSWVVTIPYGVMKVAYALSGGAVGSLTWLVTMGNTELAKEVWVPSMTGDYIVRPENLTGERDLHFVGKSPNQSTP